MLAYTREDLATAEQHVTQGEKHVARQREIVQQVAADPKLKQLAERLLAEMENALSAHRDHLEHINKQLRSQDYPS